MSDKKIPEATVMRLSVYTRYLKSLLEEEGAVTVSSREIARAAGTNAAKVRKDLDYFGEFGTRGVGYKVEHLYGHLINILGLNKIRNVVLLGAGRLGSALALYPGFTAHGFNINTIMDVNPDIIGRRLGDVTIEDVVNLEARIKEKQIEIAILTVPGSAAQHLVECLAKCGIKAILNFSPQVLKVPEGVIVKHYDMSVYLELLSFYLSFKK